MSVSPSPSTSPSATPRASHEVGDDVLGPTPAGAEVLPPDHGVLEVGDPGEVEIAVAVDVRQRDVVGAVEARSDEPGREGDLARTQSRGMAEKGRDEGGPE